MKHTPSAHSVAATSAVTGELAVASRNSPSAAGIVLMHSSPMSEKRCSSGPAKWRIANMIAET